MGKRTHAAVLLEFLMQVPDNTNFTPEQIRAETGLNLPQFKEAKKHPEVQNTLKQRVAEQPPCIQNFRYS